MTGEIGDATDDVGHRLVSAPAVSSADAGRLYHEMRDRLVRVAAAMVGSGAIAEELVNEAFVRLQPQLSSVDNPAAYVRRIVVNLALQHLRRRRVEERVPVPPAAVVWPADIDETWAAIVRLPARQRVVLALRFYEDLSEPAIAALLGCPVGTVKSSLHRGLERLRKELS